MRLKRAKEVEKVSTILEFKKDTVNGYETIEAIGERFIETVQIGFNDEVVRIANTGDYLTKEKDTWVFPLEVRKAFQQTFFEKRGAGYSSVSGRLLGIPIIVPLVVKFNNLGKQKIDKRDVKTWDLEETWLKGLDFVPEDVKKLLTEAEKSTLFSISNKQIQSLVVNPTSDNLSRALFFIVSANQDKFISKYVTTYVDEPTETWEGADIDVTIGDDEFHFDTYGKMCKNEFSLMLFFDFKDELIRELDKLGYKKRF